MKSMVQLGQGTWVRPGSVDGVLDTNDGWTRLFLSSGIKVDVHESVDEVVKKLAQSRPRPL